MKILKHIKLINIKLLISMKNQIIKKSFKNIDKIENNSKLDIIKNLVNILKKIKNFLTENNLINYYKNIIYILYIII